MPSADTTPEAAALQLELLKQAGPARRASIAADLSDAVRETTLAGLRRRHPEFDERQLAQAFIELVYGNGKRG
jgi:hypothetical protein